MNEIIQIIAPSFKNNDKYPDISRYPYGRTIGYLNCGDEAFYIQIIVTTKIVDGSEGLTILPIIQWDDVTVSRLKAKMEKSIVEIYYLDRPKYIAENISFKFNKGFQNNIIQLDLIEE